MAQTLCSVVLPILEMYIPFTGSSFFNSQYRRRHPRRRRHHHTAAP